MPLSEYERKVIEDLERHFDLDEPPLINHEAERLCVASVAAILLGVTVLLLTFRSSTLIAIVGFALLFAGSVGAHLGVRQGGLERLTLRQKRVPKRRASDF